MSLKDWTIVLDKLSSQPLRDAKLMGLGEPFFYDQFHEICRQFKEKFPSTFTITATNCQYKLNQNFVKTLPSIDLLYLSIDGYEGSYEKARPGAEWSTLIQFLDDLLSVNVGRTRFAVNYVVTEDNFRDIDKIHALVDKKYGFIEEVRLNIAQWWNEKEEIQIEMSQDFFATLKKYKANVKGKAPWTYSDCFWPKRGFYMDVNGDVKICCLNTSTEPVGNIFKSSVEELLRAPKRLRIAEECRMNRVSQHCHACDYKRLSPILERVFLD
jgi:radical SAM protein with 4Fe4S-binding SPASM domain